MSGGKQKEFNVQPSLVKRVEKQQHVIIRECQTQVHTEG